MHTQYIGVTELLLLIYSVVTNRRRYIDVTTQVKVVQRSGVRHKCGPKTA